MSHTFSIAGGMITLRFCLSIEDAAKEYFVDCIRMSTIVDQPTKLDLEFYANAGDEQPIVRIIIPSQDRAAFIAYITGGASTVYSSELDAEVRK